MISLLQIFKKGKKRIKKKEDKNRSIITNIIIDEEANTPYIKIKINKKEYQVMLDSGASTSVFDSSILEEIKKDCPIELIDIDKVVAGFGEEQDVEIYEIPILLNKRVYFINVSFANLGIINNFQEEYDLKLIGVIGMDFFMKYKCILNFYDKKLYGIFNNKKK